MQLWTRCSAIATRTASSWYGILSCSLTAEPNHEPTKSPPSHLQTYFDRERSRPYSVRKRPDALPHVQPGRALPLSNARLGARRPQTSGLPRRNAVLPLPRGFSLLHEPYARQDPCRQHQCNNRDGVCGIGQNERRSSNAPPCPSARTHQGTGRCPQSSHAHCRLCFRRPTPQHVRGRRPTVTVYAARRRFVGPWEDLLVPCHKILDRDFWACNSARVEGHNDGGGYKVWMWKGKRLC